MVDRVDEENERRAPRDGVLRIHPPAGGAHGAVLVEVTRAYARGDFGTARRLARQVKTAEHSSEEGQFADEILRRTANDPLVLLVALGCLGLFLLVVYLTAWRPS